MKEICIGCGEVVGENENPDIAIKDETGDEASVSIIPCDKCVATLKERNDVMVIVHSDEVLKTFYASRDTEGLDELVRMSKDGLSPEDADVADNQLELLNILYVHPMLAVMAGFDVYDVAKPE